MNLDITKTIEITLDWDNISHNTKSGRFNGTIVHEEKDFSVQFDLFIEQTLEHINGDYYNPPETNELGLDLEVSDIVIYDLDDNEIDKTDKEIDLLRLQIIENLSYD